MANNRLSEGVGKKIVEALKKQSEIEVNAIKSEDEVQEENLDNLFNEEIQETETSDENFLDDLASEEENDFGSLDTPSELGEESLGEEKITFQETPATKSFMNYQQPPVAPMSDNFVSELDNFEIPSNIAVLKKLITQLPSGVTRHTGAQIIKQTMEALGISMKSVLQEAQQVQEGLNNSAKECQATIQEYKKHIINLEKQAQSHQRQYSALNELISLFIQTGR